MALRDKFERPGVRDEEWIEELRREGGWTVLSGDLRIARKRPSRELFLRAGMVGFFPMPALMELPLPRLTARILTVWPNMIDLVSVTERGVFEIGVTSRRFKQITG